MQGAKNAVLFLELPKELCQRRRPPLARQIITSFRLPEKSIKSGGERMIHKSVVAGFLELANGQL